MSTLQFWHNVIFILDEDKSEPSFIKKNIY